ncbi:MAG: spermidine/putrescine ABC transporter substrate-binding protein [Acutalibacteraceae bacterium]|nr:spermidine/putrescine ABC transporter substrate-binding protein [Acutalibacteraceae bacterium]
MKKIFCVLLSAIIAGSTAVVLTGCGEKKEEINVFNWGEYISIGENDTLDTIAEFEERYNVKVNYTNYESNEEMYNLLKESNSSYDVIIPSDYMISKLIEEDMLEKINFDNIPNFKNVMEDYKTTDFDPNGEYSVPYSWGVVALAYNKTMVKEKPKSFSVLWDKKYSGNILMFNNSRDAMAIAMKLKGITPTTVTTKDIDVASAYLREQKPILKKYVMDQVFTEMETDQAALAPYYAGDVAIMMSNNENIDYTLPEEGSNLFIDSMCIPKTTQNKELAEKFINYMLEAEVAKANAEYIGYSTPNQAAYELLDEETKNNELIYPPKEYLDKCYTFSNLPQDVYDYMQDEFLKVQS